MFNILKSLQVGSFLGGIVLLLGSGGVYLLHLSDAVNAIAGTVGFFGGVLFIAGIVLSVVRSCLYSHKHWGEEEKSR